MFKSEFYFSFIRKFCVKRECRGMASDTSALKKICIYKIKNKCLELEYYKDKLLKLRKRNGVW